MIFVGVFFELSLIVIRVSGIFVEGGGGDSSVILVCFNLINEAAIIKGLNKQTKKGAKFYCPSPYFLQFFFF